MGPEPEQSTNSFDSAWNSHHHHLVGLASRMLRDPAAAEDVVQEAFSRLAGVGLHEIHDVRSWLIVVVRRLCLNRLKTAYARRESATDAATLEHQLPRPGRDGGDPADRLTLDDEVQASLEILLDRLTPAERTAFVLHDVFGFPYEAIGEIVGRTATACRQLASRARRDIRTEPPPLSASPDAAPGDKLSDLAESFIAACAGGDIDALVAMLDPDVTSSSMSVDGRVLGHSEGAQNVTNDMIKLFGPGSGARLVPLPVEESPGMVAVVRGQIGIIRLDEADDVIQHIRAVVTRPGKQ